MLKKKDFVFSVGIFLLVSLFVYACGGGGSSDTTTPANAKSSSAATKSLVNALGASDAAGSSPSLKLGRSGSDNDAKLIRKGLDALKAQLQGQGSRQKMLQAPTTTPVQCMTGSGEITSDPATGTLTESYTNCRNTIGPNLVEEKNGTMKLELTDTSFKITFTAFEESEFNTTSSNVNPISHEKINGTFTMTGGAFTNCGTEIFLSGAVITMNATMEGKEDLNADGILDWHELFTATNFTMTISETFSQAANCSLTRTTIVLNGGTSFEDKLNLNNNFSATFTNYTLTLTPSTRGTVSGEEMTANGQVTLSSACASGTYTIEIVTPLFFPTDKDCPVEGKILVTGGGATTAVIATATGGIDIDEGNNGTIEKSFSSCNDTEACIQ